MSYQDLELVLRDEGVELESYLQYRTNLRREKIKHDISHVGTVIQKIASDGNGYVITPSAENVGSGNNNYKQRDTKEEVMAIDSDISQIEGLDQNYFYINNEAGDSRYGHWDLIDGKTKQLTPSSTTDNACGSYTILHLLNTKKEIALRLNEVLGTMEPEEVECITTLLASSSEEINNFKDTKLLRRFIQKAILNYDPNINVDGIANSGYQIESEELENALSGLGIPHVSRYEIARFVTPLSAQESDHFKKVIIDNLLSPQGDPHRTEEVSELRKYLSSLDGIEGSRVDEICKMVSEYSHLPTVENDEENSEEINATELFTSPAKPTITTTKRKSPIIDRAELNLDDSSDDESSSKAEKFNVELNWQTFRQQKFDFINKLAAKGLTEDDIKRSFSLHAAGIKAFYDERVDELYRAKKRKVFAPINLEPQLQAATRVATKEIVSFICETCYHFDQVGDEANIAKEKFSNEVVSRLSSEIDSLSEILKHNRIVGKRSAMVQNVLQEYIPNFSEKISEVFFEVAKEHSLQLRQPMQVGHWLYRAELGSTLGTDACNSAISLLKQTTTPDGKAYLLTNTGSSPDAKTRQKFYNLDFSKLNYPNTLSAGWNVVRDARAGSAVNLNGNIAEITKSYLHDLAVIDYCDQAKSTNSAAWQQALVHNEIIKFLTLNESRVHSKIMSDFQKYFFHQLKSKIDQIRFERPTLDEFQELRSASTDEFLANLHLSNRSQTRAIRNFEDQGNNKGETFYRSWQLSGSETAKPALERQEITTGRVRSDFVDNAGTNTSDYATILEDLDDLRRRHKVTEITIAKWLKEILGGKAVEELQNDHNQPVTFSNSDKKILVNTTYLVFGTETARNPASLVANMMLLDLIESGKTLREIFNNPQFQDRYRGGEAPMSIGKMTVIKTEIIPPSQSNAPSSFITPIAVKKSSGRKSKSSETIDAQGNTVITQDKKEDGAPVQSARRLHGEYSRFMPASYQYEGDSHGDGDKDITRIAELVRRESAALKQWKEKIDRNPDDSSLLDRVKKQLREKWSGGDKNSGSR